MGIFGASRTSEVGRCKGKDLEHARVSPRLPRPESPIVLAPYVSVEDGTGLVHTAPGHGPRTTRPASVTACRPQPGRCLGPLHRRGPGRTRRRAGLQGQPLVVEMVREARLLFHDFSFPHSYPHCWRCKKPVIFRATEQWFIAVDHDDLRARDLEGHRRRGDWHPRAGAARGSRRWSRSAPTGASAASEPGACRSPALGCESCGTQLLTAETVRHFRDLFRAKGPTPGSRSRSRRSCPPGAPAPSAAGRRFRKEGDILDVWFESGSSHRAVLKEPSYGLDFPAYLYLEGSDQHRGWFQSSILTAVPPPAGPRSKGS